METNDSGDIASFAELITKHAAALGRHFDTVQIFCTRHDPDCHPSSATQHFSAGTGNYYARFGHMKEWVISEEERIKCRVRDQMMSEEDDEEEG